MNTQALNSLAALICRAQEQDRTPMGIAFAIEAAGRHMSPEVAAELHDLRTRLAAMANPPRELFLALYDGAEPELFTTAEAAREYCDDLAPVDAHGKCWDWAVNEYGVHVQFWTHPDDDRPMGDTSGNVTPIVVQGAEPLSELEQLRDRIAELEALTPAAIQTCRVCGAGYTFGEPCSTCIFRARMAAETSADRLTRTSPPTQALRDDDPNGLHHTYRVGRDLPELGGQR